MLELIGKRVALTYFSILNAAFSLMIFYILKRFFTEWPIYKILTISFSIPTVTLILISVGNRTIWSIVSKFDSSFYPDINGTWEGAILLGGESKSLPMKAHVRVNMFDMAMDFQSSTADSITISMALRTEKGQHFVDYIYRNESKDPSRDPYLGTATLRIVLEDKKLTMRGSYFTSRKTHGSIQLNQISA